MTFDPFGDFETRGYLRNIANEKDRDIVRRLEHASFTTGIDAAFVNLAARKELSYRDVLDTHKILFEAVYPWADRMILLRGSPISSARCAERSADWIIASRVMARASCGFGDLVFSSIRCVSSRVQTERPIRISLRSSGLRSLGPLRPYPSTRRQSGKFRRETVQHALHEAVTQRARFFLRSDEPIGQ